VFEAVPDLVGFAEMLRARGYRIAGSAPEQNLRLWQRTEPG
jgi:hypothetical protein